MAGTAGWNTRVLRSGTPTVMTNEVMSSISGPNLVFRVIDSTKRVWDRTASVVFKNNASAVQTPLWFNPLFGIVAFSSAKTTGIRVTTSYLPMATLATARRYTLNTSLSLQDSTTYSAAQTTDGYMHREGTLLDASVSIGRLANSSNQFLSALQTRSSVVVEIRPGNGANAFRGWFVPESTNLSGDGEALEEDELSFQLDASPHQDGKTAVAFAWGTP